MRGSGASHCETGPATGVAAAGNGSSEVSTAAAGVGSFGALASGLARYFQKPPDPSLEEEFKKNVKKSPITANGAQAAHRINVDARWEKLLAYKHFGWTEAAARRVPETPEKVHDDVQRATLALLADAGPRDACVHLQIEEFKCLKQNQYLIDPEGAATECVKWYNEWSQCRWDQEKMEKGYSYIEPRPKRWLKERPAYSSLQPRHA